MTSCASIYAEQEASGSDQVATISNLWKTRSGGDVAVDTMTTIILRQHDPNLRMLDQIMKINGEYRLAFTKEEALKVGIPERIYHQYEIYVEQLNKKDND